jgi:uncharacterized coiled-coil DUF342 family protein
MITKHDRWSNEYRLAEKIVHLQEALRLANKSLNEDGKLGVCVSQTVGFRDGAKFHAKVRTVLESI